MRPIRPGERGPAVVEIRSVLTTLGVLTAANGASDLYDDATEQAVRAFQQSRGLSTDGVVGEETWLALDGARWRLGQRALYHGVSDPFVGDDVAQLQERLLEMGYDPGRCDGIYGQRPTDTEPNGGELPGS